MFLVSMMAVLIVTLAVVKVFQSLFAALGDLLTARVLSGFSIACLVMLAIDVLLLVGALGMLAAQNPEFEDRRRNRSDHHPD